MVKECRGASSFIISNRMDMQTSSVCSSSRGSCHCGSNKNKVQQCSKDVDILKQVLPMTIACNLHTPYLKHHMDVHNKKNITNV